MKVEVGARAGLSRTARLMPRSSGAATRHGPRPERIARFRPALGGRSPPHRGIDP